MEARERVCVSIYLVSSDSGPTMVLILDDNSEIGSHVRMQFLLFDTFKAFD